MREELKRATDEGRLVLLPVERMLDGGPRYTAAEVAERSGLPLEELAETWRAIGIAQPEPDEPVFSETDVEAARRIRQAQKAGFPTEANLELARVMSRGTTSVAAAVTRLFGEAFLRPGDTERDVALRYAEATRELRPLLASSLDHVLGIHLREEVRQAVVDQELLASGSLPGAQVVTVCFADLVGFTKLGERVPADELGAVAGRLDELAAEAARPPVRLVKTLGDAAMLVSAEADPVLEAALGLVEGAEALGEEFPLLHAGVAHGEAIPRGGDWYGAPVNLASRITSFARPGSVVADKDVREAAGDGYSWSFAGKRRFKGVRGETAVYRVRRAE
jgi:adenylate cyclase